MNTFEKLKTEIAEEAKSLLIPEINKIVRDYMTQKGVEHWHRMIGIEMVCELSGLSREKVKEIILIENVPCLTAKKRNRFGEGLEIKVMYKDFLEGLEKHIRKSSAKTTGRSLSGGSWGILPTNKKNGGVKNKKNIS